jgi:urease accessory protein
VVHDCSEALPLTLRQPGRPEGLAQHWRLPLQAHERSQLRGRRVCQDGQVVVLQLPRQEPLRPGEWLLPAPGGGQTVAVEVVAADEDLLEIRAATGLALLQAAYHLGNRHVAMEVHADRLLLLDDSVLADLLVRRGLALRRLRAPFRPEPGAYESHAHSHSHAQGHHDAV